MNGNWEPILKNRPTLAKSSIPFFVIVLVVLFDQLSKAKFASSYNSGIAFGFFSSLGLLNTVVAIIIVSLCSYFLLREKRETISFALSLIIGGGVSNIVDRLALGGVRDFVDLGFWPSFNLADSAVTIGVVLLAFLILFGQAKHERA